MYERVLSGEPGGAAAAERLRIERLEMLDELEEWWLIQVSSQAAPAPSRGQDLRQAAKHGQCRQG